jgi:photosystem II stability/assembly factor-like uncharacterized protein
MKNLLLLILIIVVLSMSGCTKDIVDQPIANKQPKTFLWLFPDSTIAEGHSRQHIRWWGEDGDGIIKGYLIASDSIKDFTPTMLSTWLDTVTWHWTTQNDSTIAFPLLVKRDTFQIAVRAVDNTLRDDISDTALISIRFVPSGMLPSAYSGVPFWDKNNNGQPDPGEPMLNGLRGAVDPGAATLGIPVLNQPPSVVFAQDPNNTSVLMQQPETTFTAATFAWIGSDPDGDQTIADYEIALNDTSNPASWFTVPSNIRVVTFVVPRSRSNPISGVQEVNADVWSGTFSTTRRLLGTIPHLKLDTLNNFFVRARDVAGDISKPIKMPSDTTHRWFVKNPRGSVLIVSDYISSDRTEARALYEAAIDSIFNPTHIPALRTHEVLDIGAGLTAQDKNNSKFGKFVPPFLDPALIFTFELFDVVLWYTDQYPSLGVAQVPLYQYVRDPAYRGKVIFSTMFENTSDPRGALTDFSPLDSISSVNLVNSRLLPTLGDNQLPSGYSLWPDSSNPSDVFPTLTFGTNPLYSVYLRSIYKRADAQYIYHIQKDYETPVRYTYLATLSELRSVAVAGQNAWACGVGGTIIHSNNGGITWAPQISGTTKTLESAQFLNDNVGWIVGGQTENNHNSNIILQTNDGGQTWVNPHLTIDQILDGIYFADADSGIIVGTNGTVIRTTDAGRNWKVISSHTNNNIRSVHFFNQTLGLAVGDNGLIIKTTNGGASWNVVTSLTVRKLNSVRWVDATTAIAVGANGTVMKSTDAGDSWISQTFAGAPELRSVYFVNTNGWICGINGDMFHTIDGGVSWIADNTAISRPLNKGQTLNNVAFADAAVGLAVGTGGIILRTDNGNNSAPNSSWAIEPQGQINVGVIDGVGIDGFRSFVFVGLPLHMMDNSSDPNIDIVPFLRHVIHDEFGK